MKTFWFTAIVTFVILWFGSGILGFILSWMGPTPYIIITLIAASVFYIIGYILGKNNVADIKYYSYGSITGIIPILIWGMYFYFTADSEGWLIILPTCFVLIAFFVIGLSSPNIISKFR